jgi:hypothetical protein
MATRMQKLKSQLGQLPPENLAALTNLFSILHKIQENKDVNKMTSENLAVVVGPNLLREHSISIF